MNNGQRRADIYQGVEVDIVLKKDQPSGKLTHGIVKDLLTSKALHPRGIKVRLTSGQVGRVQKIYNGKVTNTTVTPEVIKKDEDDFDNFI